MALTKDQVLRAWKDDEYRNSLPAEDKKALPARPTNEDGSAMTDEQLETAAGAGTPIVGVAMAGAALGNQLESSWD